LMPFEHIY